MCRHGAPSVGRRGSSLHPLSEKPSHRHPPSPSLAARQPHPKLQMSAQESSLWGFGGNAYSPSVLQRHVYWSPQRSRACSVAGTDFPSVGHQSALHFILHTPNSGADRPSFESLLVLPPISCVSWDKILYLSLSLIQNTGIIRAPTHHRFIPREGTQTEYKHSTDIGKH